MPSNFVTKQYVVISIFFKMKKTETRREVLPQHYIANKWQSRNQTQVFWLKTSAFSGAQFTHRFPANSYPSEILTVKIGFLTHQ